MPERLDKEKKRTLSLLAADPYLQPYRASIERRQVQAGETVRKLTGGAISLADFASAHEYYGFHFGDKQWIFREWAPNATAMYLVGDFSNWKVLEEFRASRINDNGDWELRLAQDMIKHGQHFKLRMHWQGGEGDRLPAYARRVVQDPATLVFTAQVWAPETAFTWKNKGWQRPSTAPLVYEAHVGMAQEKAGIGTYVEFRDNTLPRIASAGYNTIQLMAVMEHPYYGSFGYHVSNFFAASSRFGTPEELKSLIDAAHGMGISVIMDLVHSHAATNEVEGLSRFDGSLYQYFHDGPRGKHAAWDSRCFDYGKSQVVHFLLSNCRFWLDEYKVDGFRFDGITSMLYLHHGLGPAFDHYDRYFDASVDENAVSYLTLANRLIHELRPDAITIAEDVSGMPGLAAPSHNGGIGFDYRLAMGIPDCWFKNLRAFKDEDWNIGWIWHELTNHRKDERTISYVESHDQSIVGDKTSIFWLIDANMYHFMRTSDTNLTVDRGIALHKMMRMFTMTTADGGYLNFIGNEFGHPEWVDFPREGNRWSYHYARRQWSLRDNPELKYRFLAEFDKAIVNLVCRSRLFDKYETRLLCLREGDKTIAFERGGFIFVFNFHPSRSFKDYGIPVPPGTYELVLDSDSADFGGHGRISANQRFTAQPVIENREQKHFAMVYLPSRTALVLKNAAL